MAQLCLAQQTEADDLLSSNSFALLTGMVLDQQIPLEKAFMGPLVIQQRLGKPLTPETIMATEIGKLREVFSEKPAIHRFPGANAERVHELARIIVEDFDGNAAKVWTTASSGDELLKRINSLPGFGERKAKIFLALLAKQLEIKPRGWQKACSPFGDKGTTMSVADIVDETSLLTVRQWKKEQKAKN